MQLRDYQIELSITATALLQQYGIAYLSMEVRTGKTATALTAANNYGAKSVLFLTKKKAVSSIVSDHKELGYDYMLTVTNYEQAGNILDSFDLIILDEAHSLGQFPSPAKKNKVIKKLSEGKPIIYLSGTPTPESYSQIFHQFHISSFSPFKQYANFYKWAADYVTVRKRYFYNREINDYSNADKAKIRQEVGHLFLSYTQEEAGFRELVDEEILLVPMKESTYKLAERLRISKVYSQNGHDILADTEVKLMGKLHQIFSGSVIDNEKNVLAFDDSKAKFISKRFAGKKIAIFYKYTGELTLIERHFKNLTTSPEEFNSSNDLTFVSQVQSGREGVNLSTADCIVMFNIDFSAVSYFQSRARLLSKDRIRSAKVYWIFSLGGIEEKIYPRVIGKKDYTLNYFKKDYAGKRNTKQDHQAA